MPAAALGNDDQSSSKGPAHLGRYGIVRELGKGGMARVFEARHTELDRRVALKVMQPALAAQPSAAARFLREAKAACHIRHQHVVEVFDIGTDHGLPYIVMEFLEGSNLAALLAEKGPLPLEGIANIFLPVVSAVATAHAAGVIHRDLKPANLMLTRRPPRSLHPIVLDFGISKITDDELESTLTRSESLLGTVQYMAPELTKGAKFASAASDQYALGVMLYECATGRRPFTGPSHYELMHAIVTAPVIAPSQLKEGLPAEFDALVERAMHRDPTKRFPSVHALGGALLSFADKAAWALWEPEFVGSRRDDPWALDGGTLHDAEETRSRSPAAVSRGNAAATGRWVRTALVPLGIYAAAVTAMLARRGAPGESNEDRQEQLSLGGGPLLPRAARPAVDAGEGISSASPIAPVRAELRGQPEELPSGSGSGGTGSEGLLQGRDEEPLDDRHFATVPNRAKATPLLRKAAQAPAPSTAPHRPASPPVSDPAGPTPSIHEGTNGAPILD